MNKYTVLLTYGRANGGGRSFIHVEAPDHEHAVWKAQTFAMVHSDPTPKRESLRPLLVVDGHVTGWLELDGGFMQVRAPK